MEIHQKVLSLLHENPNLTQRDLSEKLGVSLGKINYCINALVEKGVLKMKNFKNNKNKKAYVYILTPKGIEHKALLTVEFLKIKMNEYEQIKKEIAELKKEIKQKNK
jgi:EPS-associated MarR family transcriptional regulator